MSPTTTTSAAASSSRRSLPPHPRSPVFTPIMENEKEVEGEGDEETEPKEATTAVTAYQHQPTPLHPSTNNTLSTAKANKPARSTGGGGGGKVEELSVACNKCLPSPRDKTSTSVVPLDSNGLVSPGPNGMLRSLLFSLRRWSPRSSASSSSSSSAAPSTREEEWKLAVAELSRKLIQATRKRDEAVDEASCLKQYLAELEKKLDRLESYCLDLKSALDSCGDVLHPKPKLSVAAVGVHVGSLPVDPFLRAISEARSGVRNLSRALSTLMRQGAGPKSMDRLAALLHPYDIPAATCRNPRSLLFYLEALLNRVFYADFETGYVFAGGRILDPAAQCEANRKAYELVLGVSWDDVLSRGTRYYSEGLSRFCDRRMGEVVNMLGWAKAWPEALLQAFFGAAKGVWLVYLLARFVHPAVPLLRVEPGNPFDQGYMEDVAAERVRRLSPISVKMLVAPGFYVYAASCGVVKCKVLCVYNNSIISSSNTNSDSVDGAVV